MTAIARMIGLTPALAAASCCLLLACAGGPPPAALPAGVEADDLVVPYRINDEMRFWVHRRVPEHADPLWVMQRLLYALQEDQDGLRLTYREGHTGTAEEVFASREANCLSFSHLLVGLARELGIAAYYLAVDRRQEIEKEDQLVVIMGHVTVAFGHGAERRIIEFHVGPDVDHRSARPISDRRAQAHHYSNRGAEELRAGRLPQAIRLLEIATGLGVDLPEAWLNLGVARRRNGDLEGADRAYRRAIEIDSDYLPAYLNLAGLTRLRGDLDGARKMLRLLDRKDNRNPFILLSLGDFSLSERQLADARRFYRRAYRLDRSHAETRAAMGQWALTAGRPDQAQRWLARARAADPENLRVRRLTAALKGSPTPPADRG